VGRKEGEGFMRLYLFPFSSVSPIAE